MLTPSMLTAKLNSATALTVAEIGVSETNGASRPQSGFFMRKTSVLHYVGLSGAVARLAGPFVRYANLIQSGSMIGVMLPGLKPYKRT